MTPYIENESLKVAIAEQGAELSSVFHKQRNKELLWQADPSFWPRKAPVLFPVVGKLNGNSYSYQGSQYTLPQHGFARDRKFRILERSINKITFVLSADEESLKVYPFHFELRISYSLEGPRLIVGYEVLNKGQKPLFFSIGAHPGFVCPLNENESFDDYFLEFEKEETLDRHLLDDGVFNGKTERVMTSEKILELNDELFKKDAIVFKNMRSDYMTLKSKSSDYSLKFSAPGFPYFGIWKKPGAAFICLEPWMGIADNKDHSGDITKKEGINQLDAARAYNASYFLECM